MHSNRRVTTRLPASHYAPAIERRRARQGAYVALVAFGLIGLSETLCFMLSIFGLFIFVHAGMWWWVAISGFFSVWFGCRSRLDWAALSWAWHSITTGEEFIWPQRHAS
jgi:hypothetical protein